MDSGLKIGFVGLGRMGRPMARNLAGAGHRLNVFDLRVEAAGRLAAESDTVAVARSLPETAAGVEVIITMLPDGGAVREAVLGTGTDPGLVAGAGPGTLFIEMSSSAPEDTRVLADDLNVRGLQLIDAPVSGGVGKAEAGTLAIIVGGDQGLLERAVPLFEILGTTIFHAGPVGAGHAMKALNNYVSAAGFAAAAEALKIAAAAGIDPEIAIDIFNGSTGRNNSTENKFKQQVLNGSFASGFSLGLMAKDLSLAAGLAQSTSASAPLLDCCLEQWRQAVERLGPAVDHTEFFNYAGRFEP